jgi:hypothetical protein
MYGEEMYAKDIYMICTPTSLKALKLSKIVGSDKDMWNYWKQIVKEEDNIFGICKHEKESKRGYMEDAEGKKHILQQSSYQMLNSMPMQIPDLQELTKFEVDFVMKLKNDNKFFIDYVKETVNENNSNFKDVFLKTNIYKKFLYVKSNATISIKNFFDISFNEDNWLSMLCKSENLDGFLINSEGARFERFEGNDMNRLCMGIKFNNQIVKCKMLYKTIKDIIDQHNYELKYYIEDKDDTGYYNIGISYHMLHDERFKSCFENINLEITNKDLWNIVMDLLIEKDIIVF